MIAIVTELELLPLALEAFEGRDLDGVVYINDKPGGGYEVQVWGRGADRLDELEEIVRRGADLMGRSVRVVEAMAS